MEIHTVIQQRRRALGLTQEQVAAYLGVTAPAVNKWEKGSTCPDIGLLPPLARLLKVDMNTLFGFYEDLTEQELVLICKEVTKTVQSDGFKAGFSLAQEKIHTYPNSDKLLHALALQLQGLLAVAELPKDPSKTYLAQINAWYEKLADSEEASIRNGACYMLASRAVSLGQYDKAQEYLDKIPNRNDTPDKRSLQASVYLATKRPEAGAKLMEQTLLSGIGDMQTAMYKLIDMNIALGNLATASYVAERSSRLAEVLDLSPYSAVAGPFIVASARKDVRQSVALIRRMVDALSSEWDMAQSPLYRRAAANSASSSQQGMVGILKQGLSTAPEYGYLREDPEFQAIMEQF